MGIEDIFAIKSYHGYIFQILLAEALFIPLFTKRSKFYLRVGIGLPLYILSCWIIANLLQFGLPQLTSFSIFLLSLGLGAAAFKDRFKNLVFCYAGAQLIQNLAHNIEGVIYVPFAERFNVVGQFFHSVIVMVIVYIIAYFVIVKRMKRNLEFVIPTGAALFVELFSVLFCYVVQAAMRELMPTAHWISIFPLILCDLLTIALSFGFISYLAKANENRELERLIAQSDEYYAMVANNIEAINMKAHDLKHFIDGAEGKSIDSEGISELKKAVEDYDMTSKTGNKALDNVVANYMMLCRNEGIPFFFFVDANSLSFLKPGDLASMFGNLLSNALEAERKVKEKDKAYISFKVARKGDMVSVHFENYWPEKVEFVKGLPSSTKKDAANHGYGSKSICYVVGKYGGTASFSQSGEIFEVNALFPKQN